MGQTAKGLRTSHGKLVAKSRMLRKANTTGKSLAKTKRYTPAGELAVQDRVAAQNGQNHKNRSGSGIRDQTERCAPDGELVVGHGVAPRVAAALHPPLLPLHQHQVLAQHLQPHDVRSGIFSGCCDMHG